MNWSALSSRMQKFSTRRKPWRALVLIAAAAITFLAWPRVRFQGRAEAGGGVAEAPLAELRQRFESPPAAARPLVRWWWPGGDVTDEEISRELRLMKDAGIGGVEIQSFKIGLDPKPAPEVEKRVNGFLTPEWFGHVKHAIAVLA